MLSKRPRTSILDGGDVGPVVDDWDEGFARTGVGLDVGETGFDGALEIEAGVSGGVVVGVGLGVVDEEGAVDVDGVGRPGAGVDMGSGASPPAIVGPLGLACSEA
jgi:hypothetical protein